jgi:hypothetical protein
MKLTIAILSAALFTACGPGEAQNGNNSNIVNSATNVSKDAQPIPTPSNKFTAADVAKLKWIEGSWKGMDGDKPFFERYKIEDSAMVVETLKDETGKEVTESGRFELKNGEFGKEEGGRRAAASEIGEYFVQFVPAGESKGNSYRFERKGPDTWHAILEWPTAAGDSANKKVYVMERIK